MLKLAYAEGVQTALAKFALALPTLKPVAEHALELAGLGLIAAPVAHSIIAGEENESPGVTKLKHTSDLAGLAMLAAPTALQLLQKH